MNLADRVFEGAKILDSRDVIARVEELEKESEAASEELKELEERKADGPLSEADEARCVELTTLCEKSGGFDDEDDFEEYKRLRRLCREGEQEASDWADGATLILDSYFEEYAQELADDIGAVSRDAKWPANHIDWAAAAEELQTDYASITYGDSAYWVLSC